MADLLIDDLDNDVIAALQRAAQFRGVSVEEEGRRRLHLHFGLDDPSEITPK